MILLIDNYDSFVFNLARYLEEAGQETLVVRNDQLTLAEIRSLAPAAIVISPGPKSPTEAGISISTIQEFAGQIPMLGVCLGHQAMAAAFGGRVIRAPRPIHGKTSWIHHTGSGLFQSLPNPFRATRYHSLLVDESTLPTELRIPARTPDGLPMALEHREFPMYGVQFHPESILTEHGHALIANFLQLAGISSTVRPAGDTAETLDPRNWQIELPLPDYPPVPLDHPLSGVHDAI